MKSKKIYLISYTGYGHPEWNIFVDDNEIQHLFNEIEKYKWVRPDTWAIDVETMEVLLDFLGKLGICGFPAEYIKQKLDEILEKLENC
ncbi:MAG: hypothetical protein QXP96_04930 [Thermoproteota archaeon]